MTPRDPLPDRAPAEALDAADELAPFRDRFVIPDPSVIYFDGNSLGRLPKATVRRMRDVVEREWGDRLIRSWDEGWQDLAARVGDRIGTSLLGARPGEVIVADSTTVNFYKLCSAALDARPGRRFVVTDRDNFPTDRYVLEGLAAARGLTIRWIDGDPVDGPTPAQVAAALDEDVALATFSHVAYRTAAIADMAAITGSIHDAGALSLWDLSHSVGSIPVDLTGSGADLAVGCTYKYLNGGPGAPAFLYVRSELQGELRQPIWGWWGRRDLFGMGPGYEGAPGIRASTSGTPAILSLAAVEAGVEMIAQAGIDRIRAKGMALTGYAAALWERWLAPAAFTLASQRDAGDRGSHVLLQHARARPLFEALLERGIVPDYREPNGIRVGLAPLTTRFVDVHEGFHALACLAAE
jgi:kynureninase